MTSRKLVRLALAAGITIANAGLGSAQSMFGPGKFKIEQSDDRFSAGGTTTITGWNNKVSKKAPSGGMYVGSLGIYLEPTAVKSKADGRIISTGFIFHHETFYDTNYGSPNSLGVPQRVSFLLGDGRLISATINAGSKDFGDRISYNSISRSASAGIREMGIVQLSAGDMAALAAAQSVAIKIEGTQRSVTFEQKDVAKSFLANVSAFVRTSAGSR
jgi:hypothetical protein